MWKEIPSKQSSGSSVQDTSSDTSSDTSRNLIFFPEVKKKKKSETKQHKTLKHKYAEEGVVRVCFLYTAHTWVKCTVQWVRTDYHQHVACLHAKQALQRKGSTPPQSITS